MKAVKRASRSTSVTRWIGCGVFALITGLVASDASGQLLLAPLGAGLGFLFAWWIRFGPLGAVGVFIGLVCAGGMVAELGGQFGSLEEFALVAGGISLLLAFLTYFLMGSPGRGHVPITTSVEAKAKASLGSVVGFALVLVGSWGTGEIHARGPPPISRADFQARATFEDPLECAKHTLLLNRGITEERYRATSASTSNDTGNVSITYAVDEDSSETKTVKYFVRRDEEGRWFVAGASEP